MSEPIQTKRCSKCKEIKAVSEFYLNTRSHKPNNPCKKCIYFSHQKPEYKAYQAMYRKTESHKKSRAKYRKTQKCKENQKRHRQTIKYYETKKRHQQSEEFKKKNRAKSKRYNALHHEIKAVHQAINRIIKSGKIPRPDTLICHHCKEHAHQYHHPNGYDIEHRFDIVPLCYHCHIIIHCKTA